MSIANFASYKAKVANPWISMAGSKASLSNTNQLWFSYWLQAGGAGVAPTTAIVPTRATAGALQYPKLFNSAGTGRIGRVTVGPTAPMMFMLCDRLSTNGGSSGTATGAQTTNFPTAALTRYTSGDGVRAAAEIYTAIGASTTTLVGSYTNQAGTSGQIFEAVAWGNTGFREINRFIPLPLQVGDTGVRAVASVTNGISTGTVGAFGITLYKPLLAFTVQQGGHSQIFDGPLTGWLPPLVGDECLFWIVSGVNVGTGDMFYQVDVIED